MHHSPWLQWRLKLPGGSSQLGGSGPWIWFRYGSWVLPSEMSRVVGGSFQPSGHGMVPFRPLSVSTLQHSDHERAAMGC